MEKGILIVISGPSGSGKGTVVKKMLELSSEYTVSVSATTRAPREGEVHGVNYYFIDRAEFEKRIGDDMMLEYADYCGNYYGTPKKEVFDNLEAGKNVILEIEVEGAKQIKKKCPEAVLLMIAPPDYPTLEARLRGRGDDVAEQVLRDRLDKAYVELSHLDKYDYIVINGEGEVENTALDIIGIVNAEKHSTSRNKNFKDNFYA